MPLADESHVEKRYFPNIYLENPLLTNTQHSEVLVSTLHPFISLSPEKKYPKMSSLVICGNLPAKDWPSPWQKETSSSCARVLLACPDAFPSPQALSRMGGLWRKLHTVWVNVGGLHAGVFLLKRTASVFGQTPEDVYESGGAPNAQEDKEQP